MKDFKKEYAGASHLFYGRKDYKKEYVGASHLFYG